MSKLKRYDLDAMPPTGSMEESEDGEWVRFADVDSRDAALREGGDELTEEQIVACIVEAGCLGMVKMSFDTGPYDITRPSLNATKLASAIAARLRSKAPVEGGEGAACSECSGSGRTDNHVTGEVECSSCNGTGTEPTEAQQALEWMDAYWRDNLGKGDEEWTVSDFEGAIEDLREQVVLRSQKEPGEVVAWATIDGDHMISAKVRETCAARDDKVSIMVVKSHTIPLYRATQGAGHAAVINEACEFLRGLHDFAEVMRWPVELRDSITRMNERLVDAVNPESSRGREAIPFPAHLASGAGATQGEGSQPENTKVQCDAVLECEKFRCQRVIGHIEKHGGVRGNFEISWGKEAPQREGGA